MDTFQKMRVFMQVVETGSFTAAARHLQISTARTSRAVSDLETRLRTRLLNRTTRRVALTDAGERYSQRCEQILACVDQAEREMDTFSASAKLSRSGDRTHRCAAHPGPARPGSDVSNQVFPSSGFARTVDA